jgi:signal transduction histidine kinase
MGRPIDASDSRVGEPARSWRRRLDLRGGGTVDGRMAAMARAAFYLYVAGGTLGLLSLALPAPAREEPAIVAASLAAYVLAALYLIGFDRLPGWVYHVTTACATGIIAVATHFGGEAAVAYPLFYLWVVLYALYFFSWRQAAVQIALAVVAYVLVLELGTRTPSSVQALVTGGTAFVAGAMALLVKARLEGLLEKLDRSNRLLREQNARLRQLDRQKDELVSLVSHELKTPLTSIRGYVDLMVEDRDSFSEEHQRFLAVVDRSVDRLLKVLAELLFLAQVDERTLALEIEPVDLPAVSAEGVSRFTALAEQKQVALSWTADPLPALRADRVRLAQLVDNLVSNAIKFTPRGGRVEVSATACDGNAILTVSDSGIGIPAPEQARVFERFFRASNSDDVASSGTGLGLAIAKAIVEAHGGELKLESTEGVGTTVTAAFPVAEAALPPLHGLAPAGVAAEARDYGGSRAIGGR